MTSDELGRWGETRFATMCSEVCLVPHRPNYDLNGWDFFLEFPHPIAEAGTDTAGRQQPLQCFVQVKTIWKGQSKVDLRLSAAARLGKMALPSFLCILEASEAPEICRLHVLHMAGPLLERVLRKLREMQAGGRSTLINKVDFRVPVPRASESLQPTGAALLRATQEAVGPDHATYRREKDTFLRTAGFPTAPVTGSITIRAENQADYSDFLLGLKPLPVVDFTTVETRWGISLPFQFEAAPATVRAVPRPLDVEVVWRRIGAFGSVRLKMQAIHAPSSNEHSQMYRWLVTHPNLEMRIDGNSYIMTVRGPDTVPMGYRALVQLHALEELLASGAPVDVQMLFRGKLIMAWRPEGPLELRPRAATTALGKILKELGVILSSAGLQDVQLPSGSWKEWREHLRGLFAILQAPDSVTASVALDVLEGTTLEAGERETLYVTALEFDDHFLAYYATCRGRLAPEDLPRRWRLHANDFVIRDLRQLEKSEEAMRAFAKEAEAITGLITTVLMWGIPPGQPESS